MGQRIGVARIKAIVELAEGSYLDGVGVGGLHTEVQVVGLLDGHRTVVFDVRCAPHLEDVPFRSFLTRASSRYDGEGSE